MLPWLQTDCCQSHCASRLNKSTGVDEIVTKTRQLDADVFSEILCAIWNKYGEMRYMLTDWQM